MCQNSLPYKTVSPPLHGFLKRSLSLELILKGMSSHLIPCNQSDDTGPIPFPAGDKNLPPLPSVSSKNKSSSRVSSSNGIYTGISALPPLLDTMMSLKLQEEGNTT